MKISDKDHIERTALLWDSLGLSAEAAHIRMHGISLAVGAPAKPDTYETREIHARAWIDFNERRARGVVRPIAIKQCAEQFGISESLIERIIAGRKPGVSAIKKRLLSDDS